MDREETHYQRDTNQVGSTMEYEMLDMGIKRRARTPLAELENKEDNGKRVKVEGEIKELGKLLAQHLGSAEAANTMSAISWNCRGLGNPLTVNALQKVVLEKDPTLGSVWIELIVAENWKHCSKIIFNCVNSIVGPIFNIF